MSFVRDLRRLAWALTGGALAVACASVLGIPERALDEADATAPGATDGGLQTPADAPVFTGPPAAAYSRSAVDFGLVPCGSAAPTDQEVTITNTGGEPLTWKATLSSTPQFAIHGPAGGTLGPGASATIAIAAIAIPQLSGAGDTPQATLTIATNDANNPSTDLPIKITAGGGVLSIVPTPVALGEAYFDVAADAGTAAADVPIAFRNVGNLPITISFAQPPQAEFALRWAAYPAPVVVAPDAGLPGLVGRFKPSSVGDSTSTADIQLSGATCGTNPTSITLTGKGIGTHAAVQPGSLDFGMVNCGQTAAPQSVTVSNSDPANAFTIQSVTLGLGTSSPFTLPAVLPTTVPAGGSVTIPITPKPIPSAASTVANGYSDTLSIVTNAPADSAPHVVPLLMTARGAVLSQSTSNVAFGSVRVTTTATSTFTVSNDGNAAATVSYSTGTTTFSVSPQNQVVTGGSNYTATVSFSPAAQQPYSDTATMTVSPDTALCAPLPAGIALSGQGAVSATLTPSSVDFGLVNCGSTGTAQNVTLTNTGTSAITSWAASLGKGASSPYTITPASGSTISPGGSVVIKVTPKAIPSTSPTTPDLYSDTLTVNTSPMLESPYISTLHMTARGAVLSFSPTSVAFGSVRVGRSASLPFAVVNEGNRAASYTLSVGGSNPGHFSVTPTNATANASSSTPENATFAPYSTGTKGATVSLSTSTGRCAPLPSPLTLSGSAYP